MILIVLSTLIRRLAFIIPSIIQPLRLGVRIICIRLISCIIIGMEISSWFGYILFLILIGGLLVIFSYVAALTPNALFSNTLRLILLTIRLTIFSILFLCYWFPTRRKLLNLKTYYIFTQERTTGVAICRNYNIIILVFLGIILLFALIAVVKVCFNQEAPLRPFNK